MTDEQDNSPQPVDTSIETTARPDQNETAARRVGVLVLGMHRSGTSALTRMLNMLGCQMPATLMVSGEFNPAGHWESKPITDLNDEILDLAGTKWDDWLPVNPRFSETLIWPQLVARGRALLRQEFGDAPLFVLKDPRICRLAEFWLEVLTAEGVETAVVLPTRNPIEVTRSLVTRDGTEEYQGLLIWLRHVLAAEVATRGQPRVFTEFATLLDDWETLAGKLSTGLDVVWPRVSPFSGYEISQFLTPDLRHHVTEGIESSGPAVSPWVRQTNDVLLRWARHGEDVADYPQLDAIRREFDEAGAIFGRPLFEAGVAVRAATQAQAERAAMVVERDEVVQRLGEAEGQFAQVSADRDARTAERDSLASDSAALAHARDQIAIERDGLAQQLAEAETRVAQAMADRDARTAERDIHASNNAALADARDKIAWRLGEVDADLARALNECNVQIGERDRLASERAALADEASKTAWRLGEVEALLAHAQINHDRAHARAAELENELFTHHSGVDELRHSLATLQSTLRQREEEVAQLANELQAANRLAAGHGDTAHAARDEAERLAQACRDLREAATAGNASHAAALNRMQRELKDAQAARQRAEDRAAQADAQKDAQDANLDGRFTELAELTKLLFDRDGEVKAAQRKLTIANGQLDSRFAEVAELTRYGRAQADQNAQGQESVEWLRQVHAVMDSAPRWWAIMPQQWQQMKEEKRLQRRGLFDAQAYLARYPDVQQQRMAPLRHYILHGMQEGRSIQGK